MMKFKTLNKIDWGVLSEYIKNNLIISNKHPEYDIWILNYSPTTQSKRLWDDYTVACRGLVIDAEGNILARPFKKFLNYEEHDPSDIDMSKSFEIFEKMDGSLIVLFYYEARMEWIVASRGSFISEQCMEAKNMIPNGILSYLDKTSTYIFEVIYPENRIVVDYGDTRDIILLGIINTLTGHEVPYDEIVEGMRTGNKINFSVVKKHDILISNLLELKKLEEDNREGFVIRFSDGFRVKIKFAEYIRLHGVITNVSNLTIWEHMKNNYDFDILLDRVPDEFFNWLTKTAENITMNYNEIERLALKEFLRIYHVNNINDRKSFAAKAMKTVYRSILFKLYDKRQYSEIIWNMVKPDYTRPFKDGYNVK